VSRWIDGGGKLSGVANAPDDGYLSLKALAAYAGLSVRTLRDRLRDGARPLPCYRVGGKVLVRRSEFDSWIQQFHRTQGATDMGALVDNVVASFRGKV
jgi:excisionase family DNA binding protein